MKRRTQQANSAVHLVVGSPTDDELVAVVVAIAALVSAAAETRAGAGTGGWISPAVTVSTLIAPCSALIGWIVHDSGYVIS